MNDIVRWNRRPLFALATSFFIALSHPAGATGQEGRTYRACYVPEVGAVYLVGDKGLPSECRSPSHVAFSWTDGSGRTDAVVTDGETAPTDEPGAAEDDPRYLLTDGVRQATDGFAVTGEKGAGAIPVEGRGMRIMWYASKGAFRAGWAAGDQWDEGSVGNYSIALGSSTVASGNISTALGSHSRATGLTSTALGNRSTASGHGSVAIGSSSQASGSSSVAMGAATIASGDLSSAIGFGSKASGVSSTSIGRSPVANGFAAFAMGNKAIADHDRSFVWSSSEDEFGSTNAEQFVVEAAGGVGIGTNSPRTQLDVSREVSGSAGIDNHVVHFRNTASSNGDVLVLHSDAADPVAANVNFITFRSADGNIGSIEGDGSGGISLNTSGADVAERLPRLRKDENIEPGQVVGLFGGAVSKATAGADQLMVVTDRAVVLGNDPGPEARADYEKVAFLGQVPVEVSGPVEPGDLLVASGRDDGAARAVSPADYRLAADGPVVGQAWEASAVGKRRVNALVGAHGRAAALQSIVERQEARLELQDTRLEEQSERLERLERKLESLLDVSQ